MRKSRPISQRTARALRKEVKELRYILRMQRYAWGASEWPDSGVHLTDVNAGIIPYREVVTARKLGHAVVVTIGESAGVIRLHALPLPEQERVS